MRALGCDTAWLQAAVGDGEVPSSIMRRFGWSGRLTDGRDDEERRALGLSLKGATKFHQAGRIEAGGMQRLEGIMPRLPAMTPVSSANESRVEDSELMVI
jgi:hypothetical protein